MFIHLQPATLFDTYAAAEAFAAHVIDAEAAAAGEYYEIAEARGGRYIVSFYESDGYKIATA